MTGDVTDESGTVKPVGEPVDEANQDDERDLDEDESAGADVDEIEQELLDAMKSLRRTNKKVEEYLDGLAGDAQKPPPETPPETPEEANKEASLESAPKESPKEESKEDGLKEDGREGQ
jgi:hypothetical protein